MYHDNTRGNPRGLHHLAELAFVISMGRSWGGCREGNIVIMPQCKDFCAIPIASVIQAGFRIWIGFCAIPTASCHRGGIPHPDFLFI